MSFLVDLASREAEPLPGRYALGRVEQYVSGPYGRPVGSPHTYSELRICIARAGRHLTGITMEFELPDGEILDDVIEHIRVEIGGKEVVRIPGTYLAMHDALFRPPAQRRAYADMRRRGILPLPLGDLLPLAMTKLTWHEVVVWCKLKTASARVKAWADFRDTTEGWRDHAPSSKTFLKPQFSDTEPCSGGTNDLRLMFNMRVRALAWRVLPRKSGLPAPKLREAQLVFNGTVVAAGSADYLSGQHALERFGGVLPEGMYVMAFGDDPEGAANFSLVDHANLRLTFDGADDGEGFDKDYFGVDVVAVTFDEIKFEDGKAVVTEW